MTNTALINTELALRIKQGDIKAFELLFKIYHKPLCNYAKVYVNRFDIADEIVQETFISLWNSRTTIDETKSLNSFLYKCIYNNSINFIKKAQTNRKLSEAYISEIEYRAKMLEGNYSESYFDHLTNEELENSVKNAIAQLPDQCREIFMLSRYEELTYQQIADKLNISINTVKTQLSRALQKLRHDLEEK